MLLQIKKDSFLVFVFFLLILITGLFTFDDYGIGIDEDNSRINGLVSLKYIFELFKIEFLNEKNFTNIANINEYTEQGNGVVFDLPLAWFELLFKVDDFRNKFLLRHIFSFLLYFLSLIYFFRLILEKHKSKLLAALGVLILFSSPRIFAQSFFNPKDLGFMSVYIIGLFYGFRFIDNPSIKTSFIFSLIAGVTVGFRILGIFLPLIIILFHFIDLLKRKTIKKERFFPLLLLVLTLPFFVTLFWPYLWASPLENFVEVFKNLSNHYRPLNNFFMGGYVSSLYVPWYYIFVWIGVTTPLSYLCFFFFGIFFVFTRFVKRLFKIEEQKTHNDLWNGQNEKKNLINLFTIFIPIFIIIILHSSLYTGWRHLYFIYPSIVLLSIQGFSLLNLLYIKKKKILFVVGFFLVFPNLFWMLKNHPYQYSYFNIFAGKNFNKSFEMDYWGISSYNALDYIVKHNKKVSYVSIIGNGDIVQSKKFLEVKKRNKIVITHDFMKADFLIDNYNRWNGIKKTKNNLIIKNYFEPYFDIKVNNISITKIYKKKL